MRVFGEIGFDVTENFTITAGGRWFDYDRDASSSTRSQPEGFSGVYAAGRATSDRTRTARS